MYDASLVSVILPVWNGSAVHLREAVFSILQQSYQNFELLIIDDGSTREETVNFLNNITSQDSRIRLIRKQHSGQIETLHHGWSEACAQIVFYQHQDDWSAPERMTAQLQALNDAPDVAVVGSNTSFHQADGTYLWDSNFPTRSEEIAEHLKIENCFCDGSVAIRKSAFQEIGGYKKDMFPSQDYDFFFRLSKRHKLINLPQALYHTRFHVGAASTKLAAEQDQKAKLIPNSENGSKDLNTISCYKTHCRRADFLVLAGNYGEAMTLYFYAIRSAPLVPSTYLKLVRLLLFKQVKSLRKPMFTKPSTILSRLFKAIIR